MSQSKKRPIPSKETPKPTKRRKLRAKKQTKDGNPLKNRKIRTPDYTDSLPIDSLAWKNVTVPNRIDDFEGFFGLEEVDDVEVSRQAENSRVEFKVRRPKQATQSGIKDKVVGPNVDRKSDSVGMDHQRGEGQEEDVWEGFSDDSNDNNYKVKALGNPEKNPKASQANGKIKNGKNRSSCSDVLEDIQFTALAEENLDANEDANDNKGRAYRHNINDKVKNLSALSTKAWSPLKLSRDALAALANMRFSKPTAIQSAAIPKIMQGRDVIGKASTGSGKTLAYGIPIFEYYLKNLGKHAEQMEDGEDEESGEEEEAYSATTSTQDRPNSKSSSSSPPQHQPPITLILSPTRELAHQIRSHLLALYQPHHSPTTNTTTALSSSSSSPPPPSQHQNPSIVTVTGGLSIQKQRRLIQHAHIVVATPGRLWEVMGESEDLLARLRNVRFLVIDEADRLFSAGHFEEFEKILRVLGRGRGGRNGEGDGDGGEEEDRDKEDGRDGIGSGVERNGIDMAENGLRTMKGGPTKTQTLIFSATFSRNLQERLSSRKWQGGRMRASSSASSSDTEQSLAYLLEKLKFENKPDFIDVNPVSQMAEGLQEGIVECGATEKVSMSILPLLNSILQDIHVYTMFVPVAHQALLGSLSILPLSAEPTQTKTRLHKLHLCRSPACPFSPGPQSACKRPSLSHATESSSAFHRKVQQYYFITFCQVRCQPRRYRRCGSRSRHSERGPHHPLPRAQDHRRVRPSLRSDGKRQQHRS